MSGKHLYKEGSKSRRFREYYKNAKIISKDIKNINYSLAKERVFVKRLAERGYTQEQYKAMIYTQFNIRQYKNMSELRREMTDYGYTQEQISKIEADYKHRDLLIGSGQYQEYRVSNYKSRYLKALRIANVNPEIIENIRKLELVDFAKLVGLRDARTDTAAKYRLPQLGGFNYYTVGIQANDKTKEIEEEIKGAFKEAKIPFNEDIIANPIKFIPRITTNTLRGTLERLFPSQVSYLNSSKNEEEYKQRAFKLLEEKILSGKKIYKERNGIATLSFIGKNIPTSRNYVFVYDFYKYINRK